MVRISLRADAKARRAVLEIEDDGPGMEAGFVRDELFRPLASTKRDGYGIGAYQCRELVRELGGQLAVATAPGRGTTIRVTLPMVGTPAGDHRPVLVAQ
jgi:signal transduction histidine kinase